MKKIIGNTLTLTPVEESHVETLASAWTEFRLREHSSGSKSNFLYTCNLSNNGFDWTLAQKGKLFLSIIDTSSNAVIGYTIFKVIPSTQEAWFLFTLILPNYREAGRYSELNILRHKFIYQDSSPIQKSIIRLSESKERQKNTLAAIYTREEQIDDTYRGKFIWSYITRDEWNTWINHSDQTNKKNSTFLIQDI